jgi:hypothetical protein
LPALGWRTEGWRAELARIGVRALKLLAPRGHDTEHPCVLLSDATVRCERVIDGRVELVALPAPEHLGFPVQTGCRSFMTRSTETERPFGDIIDFSGDSSLRCALTRHGRVACWGVVHTIRSLSNESFAYSGLAADFTPRWVGHIPGATRIAAKDDGVCVIERGGTVMCVGIGGFGSARGLPYDGRDTWRRLPALSGMTEIIPFPGTDTMCAFRAHNSGSTRVAESARRPPDPMEQPAAAIEHAIGAGMAVCWGRTGTLEDLNATIFEFDE